MAVNDGGPDAISLNPLQHIREAGACVDAIAAPLTTAS
jgi:hypothetical protein